MMSRSCSELTVPHSASSEHKMARRGRQLPASFLLLCQATEKALEGCLLISHHAWAMPSSPLEQQLAGTSAICPGIVTVPWCQQQ